MDGDRTWMTLRNRGEPAGFGRLTAPVLAVAMRRANSKRRCAVACPGVSPPVLAREAGVMEYEVQSTIGVVQARSVRRLAFEPRGWQLAFRDELRAALRGLPRRAGQALLATYDTPDTSFADMENVLLYHVGSGLFGPLVTGGVTCRRQRSRDGWHHVRYEVIGSAPDPGGGAVSARADVEVGSGLPRTAGGFWEALRPGLHRVSARLPDNASFTVDLTVTGPAAAARLAATMKPLLDGWVSATHCHDGSGRDILMPRLGNADQAAAQWAQLCDPAAAVLDTRPLLRPFRDGIAWNPADERCDAFRIVPRPGPSWAISAVLRPATSTRQIPATVEP